MCRWPVGDGANRVLAGLSGRIGCRFGAAFVLGVVENPLAPFRLYMSQVDVSNRRRRPGVFVVGSALK